jgi:amidophosphoribosyltransferase
MSTSEEMIAYGRSIGEIAAELGADSLAYLSMEGVYEAIGSGAETHCDACFTGVYPLGDGGAGNGKFALEVNGSAASSASRPGAAGSGATVAAGPSSGG